MTSPAVPVCEEAGLDGPGAVGEQLHRSRDGQPAHRHQDLPRDAERLAARCYQPQARHRPGKGVGQRGRLADDVLAVVEDNDQ